MHQPIPFEALRVLDAIDRKKSFAAAAEELFKVPSAISYTVQKLEEDLDVEIFDRSGHRAVLTPAGRYLLEQGRELIRANQALADATRQIASGWETRLNIAVDSLLPISALHPLIARFYEEGTSTELHLGEEVLAGCWDALMEHRADIVVGANSRYQPSGSFSQFAIGQVEFCFAVAAHHPLAHQRKRLSATDRAAYRAVAVADSSRGLPARTSRILDKQQYMVVPSLHDKVDAQLAGLGIGFLPRKRVQHELASGALVELDTDSDHTRETLLVAWRKEDKGRALRWFTRRLRDLNLFADYLEPPV